MFEGFKCKFDYKEVVEKIVMVELKKSQSRTQAIF